MGTWVPEYSSVPEHLRDEQRAVEAQIRAAFKGVTRVGGISWSEADVIDGYGTDEQQAAARAKDMERSWEDLVDDPDWKEGFGSGGFSFLDGIGKRYYIAPAMIRCARRGGGECVGYALERPLNAFVALLNPEQAMAIARFVRFMITTHAAENDDIYGESWQNAYHNHWRQWDHHPGTR
jgi:hypothetical protein